MCRLQCRSSYLWHISCVVSGCGLVFCHFFFFFNDTATTEIYTLSLHDALPICVALPAQLQVLADRRVGDSAGAAHRRSEEHTSELQSQSNLVCRLLLEKKKYYIDLTCTVPLPLPP